MPFVVLNISLCGSKSVNLPNGFSGFIHFSYWHRFATKEFFFLSLHVRSAQRFQAQEKLGPVDMLVNCAGMSLAGKFEDLEVGTFEVSKNLVFAHEGSPYTTSRTRPWAKLYERNR